MNKTRTLLAAASLATLVACSNDKPIEQEQPVYDGPKTEIVHSSGFEEPSIRFKVSYSKTRVRDFATGHHIRSGFYTMPHMGWNDRARAGFPTTSRPHGGYRTPAPFFRGSSGMMGNQRPHSYRSMRHGFRSEYGNCGGYCPETSATTEAQDRE